MLRKCTLICRDFLKIVYNMKYNNSNKHGKLLKKNAFKIININEIFKKNLEVLFFITDKLS